MPYIKESRREDFENENPWNSRTLNGCPQTEGELNYIITKIINAYAHERRWGHEQLCYKSINDVLGALEGAKLEFYARVARPYEEKKRIENGDVYPA